RGRGSNRPGKHLVSSIADRRLEVQSSGAACAAVTTLITSAVASDVLIVRMGVSSQLLHYARSTAGCSRSQGGWATAECRHCRTNVFRMWVQQPLASQCPLLALLRHQRLMRQSLLSGANQRLVLLKVSSPHFDPLPSPARSGQRR